MGDQAIHGLAYTQVLKRAVPRLQRKRGISPRLDVCDLLLRGRKLMDNRKQALVDIRYAGKF
jgi:hypothetical protein